MTTKFGAGIAFRKAQVSSKFHCPASTVTLFSEDREGRMHSSLVIEIQKSPTNSGGIVVYNKRPCRPYSHCKLNPAHTGFFG